MNPVIQLPKQQNQGSKEYPMERIITQQSSSNLEKSSLSQKRKLSLIRAFRKADHTQSQMGTQLSLPNLNEFNSSNNIYLRQKIQRQSSQNQSSSLNQNNSTQTDQLAFININTKQIVDNKNNQKKKNIFDNDYVKCLKKGFAHAYEQPSKIIPKSIDINQFYGPVYYSQRPTELRNNPQDKYQPGIKEEEIYKFDKNPKLLKFKVHLKRQNNNPTSNTHSLSKINQTKHTSRILITQLRTEESKLSQISPTNPINLQSKHPTLKKLQPIKQQPIKQRLHTHSYSTQINPKSIKIPKLSERSNLFKQIKIFQKKQNLLGQIELQRGLQAKYGDKMFERLVRNNYKQIQRKNDYVVKVHYKANNEPKQENFKNKFIRDIEEGKYPTNFKYKQRPIPLKLKGRTKTVPRYETIIYGDD